MLFLLILLLSSQNTHALSGNVSTDGEIGYQGTLNQQTEGDKTRVTRNRPYVQTKFKGTVEPADQSSRVSGNIAARAWRDNSIEFRELNAGYTKAGFSGVFGIQQIGWGETFGLFIADMINPRDLRDPLFNELSWVRVPVVSVNLKYFISDWNFQIIETPIPVNNRFPGMYNNYKVVSPIDFSVDDFPKDSEFAFRVGRKFESGIDASLIFFRHWSRNPAFEPQGAALRPIVERVSTMATSASQAWEDWVLRFDSVLHFEAPVQFDLKEKVIRTYQSQSILGLDRTFASQTNVGGQYHLDKWADQQRHSLSVRAASKFLNDRIEPEAFAYFGLNNSDVWIQPKVSWYPTDSLTLSLRMDMILNNGLSSKDGFLAPLENEDRGMIWLSYKL